MMKLYYIFHSGFALVTDGVTVIIDFYEDSIDALHGIVHDSLLQRPGKIYVLSTHFHPDHFNREILSWHNIRPDIVYLLSKDILRHHKASLDDAIFLLKGDTYEDDLLQVKAFGSTDSGDSFLIRLQGLTLFHAGDLNNWHWRDESTPQEIKKAESDFLTELKPISAEAPEVDVAMFPVDRRMGSDYAKGAKQFLEKIKSTIFVPMHFGNDYVGGNAFCSSAEAAGSVFLQIDYRGQCFDITKLLNNIKNDGK
jgi:L-ascorbate metabolism protein UlaG (beta-lactamase superfamily)